MIQRKISTLLLALLMIVPMVHAQQWSAVKNSPQYYWGEGWGTTIDEADQAALAMLTSQISVSVSTDSEQKNIRREDNGKYASDQTTYQAVVRTYSQATVDSTTMFVLEPAPKAHVARWIKKSDIDKLYAGRRAKVHELIDGAERAEKKGKVDVALKKLYWAYSLVQTMRKPNTEYYDGHMLMCWLPERIDEILDDVEVAIERCSDYELGAMFKYKGKPVNSLDFSYSDAGAWSNLCSAKDGVGLMELSPGADCKAVDVEIEVKYAGQSQLDPEIESVLKLTEPLNLRRAFKKVKLKDAREEKQSQASQPKESFTSIDPEYFSRPSEMAVSETEDLQAIMATVMAGIQKATLAELSPYFTPEGLSIFNKLLRFGKAKIVGTPSISYMRNDNAISARGLQMSFSFRNGVRKNFVEDVVFTFNKDKKIDNISFGLGRTVEDDILGQSAYPEIVRKLLVDFIENYQTAFALKRADYIEKIFDDDAIIIIGKVVKPAAGRMTGENYSFRTNPVVTYNRYSKGQYLTHLKESFASKEYINLRFNNIKVRRVANAGEMYGIQLEQDYYSSNYCDHGYLFLMLDLNDINNPLIMVRTWQPEPDPNFGVYGIDDFPVFRLGN